MMKRLIISEPWDFVNHNTKSNIVDVKISDEIMLEGKTSLILSVLEPFALKEYQIRFLLAKPRYIEKSHIYNLFYLDGLNKVDLDNVGEFLFVGSMK